MTEQDLLSRAPEVLTRRMSRTTMFRVAFGCIVAAEVLMLLWVGRKEWYFFDEWRLIMERVLPHPGGLLGNFRLIFRPDSEHVIGIPLTDKGVHREWRAVSLKARKRPVHEEFFISLLAKGACG